MVKTFETSKGKFLLIKKDDNGKLLLPKDCEYSELGKVSELTEEQAKEVLDYGQIFYPFKNYMFNNLGYGRYSNRGFFTSKQSFDTLLESLSITNTKDLYLFKIED